MTPGQQYAQLAQQHGINIGNTDSNSNTDNTDTKE